VLWQAFIANYYKEMTFACQQTVYCHILKAKGCPHAEFFFDMSTQEEGEGFELVTSASLGVVPTD
jgi:hypothetical protein